ncbi:DUF3800 domain-containing protein [Candidatus Roizmanbacteria bacterium]|nr:DUF3800 domain-containing protein [Candidatus Roizmanbacteria bacterium]
MKLMFLDESGDHSLLEDKIDKSYPMFVLVGCIFDLDYYSKVVEPEINRLKVKYFNDSSIILRSYDIRKQKNSFASLVDKKKRDLFLNDLDKILSSLQFTVIAAAINKFKLIKTYSSPANPYHLCFQFILERAIMFLGRNNDSIILRTESRETHNDKLLAAVYENFRMKGNKFIKPEEVRNKFTDLSFNQKTQNVIGHQIADLVAYPIGRWVLDKDKENKAFDIVETKLHCKNGVFLNYGLKIFP